MFNEFLCSFLLIIFFSLFFYYYKIKVRKNVEKPKNFYLLKKTKKLKKIKTEKIFSVILLNDKKKLATIENDYIDGYIFIYKLDTYSIFQKIELHNLDIHYLTQFKNNFLAACVSNNIFIYSMDENSKFNLYKKLIGHNDDIFKVIESKKNDTLISIDKNRKIIIWKNNNNEYSISSTIVDNDNIENLLFTNDNETIFVATYNNKNYICFYDITLLVKIHIINNIEKTHNYYNLLKFQNFLFVGGKNNTIYVINLNSYVIHHKYEYSHDNLIGDIECFDIIKYKNKNIILAGDGDGSLIEYEFDQSNGKIKFIDIKEDVFDDNILSIISYINDNKIFVVSDNIKIFKIEK